MFSDGLGRIIQSQKTHESKGVDGRIISCRAVFDSLSRCISIGQPSFIDDVKFGYVSNLSINPTEFNIDILERNLEVSFPDGTSSKTEYGFTSVSGQNLFSVLETDRKGKKKETLKDIHDLTKKIIEYHPEDKNIERRIVWWKPIPFEAFIDPLY